MKKFFMLLAATIAALSFVACKDDDETVIEYDELPSLAQEIMSDYFSTYTVSLITKDDDSYDVDFTNGMDVEFSLSGKLKCVDCNKSAIPDALYQDLPSYIKDELENDYPLAYIVEIDFYDKTFTLELNTGKELTYNITRQEVDV